MSAIPMLTESLGINKIQLSKEECLLAEAELLTRIWEALKENFSLKYKNYLRLLKTDKEKEFGMLDTNFIGLVIKDIIHSGDYSLAGIAYYVDTSEEVLTDVVAGKNSAPSFPLTRKIIDLHRTVRPELYDSIMKKITQAYSILT